MKQTIRQLILFLVVVCTGFSLAACNDEDDIDIFVGRTWKVSNFFGPAGPVYSKVEDLKVLERANSFYIKFENSTTFIGRTLDKEFNGTWSVDLKKRTISLRLKNTGNPTDAISRQMINSMTNSVSYRGDYNYLNLVDKDGAYILFYPYKNESDK